MAEIIGVPSAADIKQLNISHGYSEDQLCPNTGEVCSYRSRIVELFDNRVDEDVDPELPEGMHNADNGRKMQVRLAETQVVARLINCAGLDDNGSCPVGERIKKSSVRQGFFGKMIKRTLSI